MNFDLDSHLVLQVVSGSHAYGTANKDSDVDLRGIIIPPEEYFFGLRGFEQYEAAEGDVCYYDIRKFFKLAVQGNPNVLEILWAPRMRVFKPFAHTILDMRPQVLSKYLVRHHVGMATQHLARLKEPGRKCGISGKKAIEKHGYNTKDAAHVIRVLTQCIELLRDRKITFPRPDAVRLNVIRAGGWPLEMVQMEADRLLGLVREEEATSALPEKPDQDLVSTNLCHLIHGWLYSKRAKIPPDVLQRTLEETLQSSINLLEPEST